MLNAIQASPVHSLFDSQIECLFTFEFMPYQVREQLVRGITRTVRDIYYSDVVQFGSQDDVQRALTVVCCAIGVPRRSLNCVRARSCAHLIGIDLKSMMLCIDSQFIVMVQ